MYYYTHEKINSNNDNNVDLVFLIETFLLKQNGDVKKSLTYYIYKDKDQYNDCYMIDRINDDIKHYINSNTIFNIYENSSEDVVINLNSTNNSQGNFKFGDLYKMSKKNNNLFDNKFRIKVEDHRNIDFIFTENKYIRYNKKMFSLNINIEAVNSNFKLEKKILYFYNNDTDKTLRDSYVIKDNINYECLSKLSDLYLRIDGNFKKGFKYSITDNIDDCFTYLDIENFLDDNVIKIPENKYSAIITYTINSTPDFDSKQQNDDILGILTQDELIDYIDSLSTNEKIGIHKFNDNNYLTILQNELNKSKNPDKIIIDLNNFIDYKKKNHNTDTFFIISEK